MTRAKLYRLCLVAFFLSWLVVGLGAFTRLVDAGLGCPDWPGCYGHLTWPSSAGEVARAEARFPETPVEHDKTWPEMVHRYAASLLGLLIIAITYWSWRLRRHGESVPLKLPLALLAMVIVQGAFGAWTVTLKLWPQVVTAHLLGGFTTMALIWLLLQRLGGFRWSAGGAALSRAKPWATLALALVIVQIFLGGWTSTNYAAMACPDLPTCHGEWWPPADYQAGFNIFQKVGPNYLGGLLDNHARTAIHFVHRLGALAVTAVLLIYCVQLWRANFAPARRLALLTVGALALQIALGLSNVHFVLPLWVAVMHNAGGALLLLILVLGNHRLRTASREETLWPAAL